MVLRIAKGSVVVLGAQVNHTELASMSIAVVELLNHRIRCLIDLHKGEVDIQKRHPLYEVSWIQPIWVATRISVGNRWAMKLKSVSWSICNVNHTLYISLSPIHMMRFHQSMDNVFCFIVSSFRTNQTKFTHHMPRVLEWKTDDSLIVSIVAIANKPNENLRIRSLSLNGSSHLINLGFCLLNPGFHGTSAVHDEANLYKSHSGVGTDVSVS